LENFQINIVIWYFFIGLYGYILWRQDALFPWGKFLKFELSLADRKRPSGLQGKSFCLELVIFFVISIAEAIFFQVGKMNPGKLFSITVKLRQSEGRSHFDSVKIFYAQDQ